MEARYIQGDWTGVVPGTDVGVKRVGKQHCDKIIGRNFVNTFEDTSISYVKLFSFGTIWAQAILTRSKHALAIIEL